MAVIAVGQAKRDVPYDFTASAVAATGGGDVFTNDGQTFYIVKNGDASPHTVTFAIQSNIDGVVPTNVARSIPAGDTAIFGPFPTAIYNNGSNQVNVAYSAVTSVTVGACKMPPAA